MSYRRLTVVLTAALGGCLDSGLPADPPDLARPADLTATPDLVTVADQAMPPAPDLAVADALMDLSAPADLSKPDLAAPPDLVTVSQDAAVLETVSHPRELRGVWVGTVFRLDFPSTTTLTVNQATTELQGIVDLTASSGLNAIFFQIRPESDAVYSSTLEPWSRYLTGTQGTAPPYDPLAILIDLGHKKGIEIHAWMNPYRASATAANPTVASHVTKLYPDAAITYNGQITMNPADTRVRDHVIAVVADVTTRYDIDGVVFDDYFYPYPTATPFPDDASYSAYTSGGGMLSKSDWRRSNVNSLVSGVAAAIRGAKSWVRFGVAPFGIYRPGIPAGVTGTDAYEVLACDSVYWMNQGWVDYLAPQLYWTTGSAGQPFGTLIDWWASIAQPGRPVFASLALYKVGTAPEWTTTEMETQVSLSRAEANAQGQTWYRYGFLKSNVSNIGASFASFYAKPARPPVVPGAAADVVAAPSVGIAGDTLTLGHAAPSTIRGYAVYKQVGTFSLNRWVPVGSAPVTLTAGRYSVSAIGRGGVESEGVAVVLP